MTEVIEISKIDAQGPMWMITVEYPKRTNSLSWWDKLLGKEPATHKAKQESFVSEYGIIWRDMTTHERPNYHFESWLEEKLKSARLKQRLKSVTINAKFVKQKQLKEKI